MRKIIFYLITILSIQSCIDKKNNIIELKGENIIADIPYMKVPTRINIQDNYIQILDLAPMDSCFCHILELPTYNYIRSIGKRGNGPNEIILITPFQTYKNKIILYDGAKSNLYQYTANGELEKIKHFNAGKSIDYSIINDTTISISEMSSKYRFSLSTPSSNKEYFSIPNKLCDNSNVNKQLWRSYMKYNSELNKLAMATQFGEIIEIYNLADSSVVIIGDKEVAPIKRSQHNGYEDIQWHNNNIYALLSIYDKSNPEIMGGNIIRVFNDSGKLVNTYKLDQCINGFCINEKGNILYGISSNEDNPIFKYILHE